MNRFYQITLIGSTLALCWLGMQVVHEIEHVLAAWAGGEEVYRVILHPLTISRTDTSHERYPLLVVWGGPLAGSSSPSLPSPPWDSSDPVGPTCPGSSPDSA